MAKYKYKYEDIKPYLVIDQDRATKFNDTEDNPEFKREVLINNLVRDGEFTSIFVATGSDTTKVVLVDGHTRLSVLPEVLKRCPDFDASMRIDFISDEEALKRMMDDQVGRRNVNSNMYKRFVNTYQKLHGVNQKTAIKEVAEATGASIYKVKTSVHPKIAETNSYRSARQYETVKQLQKEANITEQPYIPFKDRTPEQQEESRQRRIELNNLKEKNLRSEKRKQERLNPSSLVKQTESFKEQAVTTSNEIRRVGHRYTQDKTILTSSIELDDRKVVLNVLDGLQVAIGSLLIQDKSSDVSQLNELYQIYSTKLDLMEKELA